MSELERQVALEQRKLNQRPWHSPPHLDLEGDYYYIITASCFEHASIIGTTNERIIEWEEIVLSTCEQALVQVFAWCILPNHYHLLIKTDRIKELRREIGLSHGRTSRKWNLEDSTTGRSVWRNCFERPLKSGRYFWASMNYVHHNAVHHGYVDHWQDWPFSSARQYLESVGREKAAEIWRQFPILDYGKKWDI